MTKMSIDIDQTRRINEMIKNFLYALHGYGVSNIDFKSVKKQQDKLLVKGSYKIRNENFDFSAEFDSYGNLLSYERAKSGSA